MLLLKKWVSLQEHLLVELVDRTRPYTEYDPARVGDAAFRPFST